MALKKLLLEEATLEQLQTFATELGVAPHPSAKELAIKSKIATVYAADFMFIEVSDAEGRPPNPSHTSPVAEAQAEAAKLSKEDAAAAQVIRDAISSGPAEVEDNQLPASIDEMAEPWYTIMIAETPDKQGQQPVPVCVNGRNLWVPRNEECAVKHRYYHAFMTAVQSVCEQPDGPQGEMVWRDLLSYPVQLIQAPTDAELTAWHDWKVEQQRREVERNAA